MDWKDTVMVIAIVYYVAKAVFSFLAGTWTFAIIEFATAGFLSILRKEIRDHANMQNKIDQLGSENVRFRDSNLKYTLLNRKFEGELTELHKEVGQFAESNHALQGNIQSMDQILREAEGKIGTAFTEGREGSKRLLREALEAIATGKEGLTSIHEQVLGRQEEAVKKWETVQARVDRMQQQQGQLIGEAERALAALHADIDAKQELLRKLNEQANRFDRGNDRFESSLGRLETATGLFNLLFKGLTSPEDPGAMAQSTLFVTGAFATVWFASKAFQYATS